MSQRNISLALFRFMTDFNTTRKNILITGGTGSLGSALVRKWYKDHNVTILSRDWYKQERLAAECPGVRFVLADICDYSLVRSTCEGQDILIHAAANKHVAIGEQNPVEYARVNIQGTQTVVRAWVDTHPPSDYITDVRSFLREFTKRINFTTEEANKYGLSSLPGMEWFTPVALYINSDKAVASVNHYGLTKACGEKIAASAGFSSIRYGNVIDSSGAFIQVWQDRIARGLPVKVRTPSPTRFALTLDQAVNLVEDVLGQEPGIYIPHSLPAFSVHDVAMAMGAEIEYEDLLPGEKRHEILLNEQEKAVRVSDLLARVVHRSVKGEGMEAYRFSSMTAPKVEGKDVVGWVLR